MSFSSGLIKTAHLDIPAAIDELQHKSEKELERETGFKWASRACAAYIMAHKEKDIHNRARLIDWGDDLRHEALEHAALSEDYGKLTGKLQKVMEKHRPKF